MKRNLFYISLFLIAAIQSFGQDAHFSQFYASPLTLNPSLTGFSPGDMRFNLNYRNQNQGYIPYTTYSGSFDFKVLPNDMDPDVIAAGLVVTSDDGVKGFFKNTQMALSMAYHKAIGHYNNHYLSFGLQAGTIHRNISPGEFSYPNQWDDNSGYVSSLPNHEDFYEKESVWLFDLNLGLMWYSKLGDESALYLGGAAYHINQPVEALSGYGDELPAKGIVHGGIRFPISNEICMVPNVIWIAQNQNRQLTGGSSFEYKIGDTESTFRLGGWYRHSDKSLIFSAGIQVSSVQIGISSDFLSPVQTQARGTGALEFSVIYTPALKRSTFLPADPTKRF